DRAFLCPESRRAPRTLLLRRRSPLPPTLGRRWLRLAGGGRAARPPGRGARPRPPGPGSGPSRRASASAPAGWQSTRGRGATRTRLSWRVRGPRGNMYEFVMAITCAAVIAFLLLLIRFRVYSVGLFFMAPVVLALGLCATVLYTAAGPLVPALHSYWIWIHVTSMTVATGAYIVAAVLTVLYLIADRYARRPHAAPPTRFGGVLHRLPPADALDRLSYRTVIFAFPIWTFAVIAGAIWADQAWGRYWGWDPKETWAFITWVVYAGYLHARATAGWRGRKAAY